MRLPIGALKLMLDKKQPAANRSRDQNDREMDQEKRRQPDREPRGEKHGDDCHICDVNASALASPSLRNGKSKPLLYDKHQNGPNSEKKKGMTINAVQESLQVGAVNVFINSQNPHVPIAALAEIAARGVMERMAAPPEPIRREREDRAEGA